ncbi:MAG: hypothetical protein O7C67_15765 [Gammaproteobacteria bacterium]|nr:hypothetical protein [Gammaproteobacteria bacterium]MCZ6658749.1 hypothetical protein [Gammaproteobacteria bacterium]
MKIGTSILFCVVFGFAFSSSAVAEICKGSHPEQCIEDNWHDWEVHHEHIKECVDRLTAAGDEHPVDDCAVEHFCGAHDGSHAACEKAALEYFHTHPQKHDEVVGWLAGAVH